MPLCASTERVASKPGLVVLPLLLATLAAAAEEPRTSLSGPLIGHSAPPWLEGAPEPQGGGPSFEDVVMEMVNQERLDNGALPPLKRAGLLDGSSETHSSNMATRNFVSHCDLDTLTMPWDRMTAAGYNWTSAGENIAAGYSTPQAVMDAWMGSSGHRANILSTSFRELGIGYVLESGDVGNVRVNTDTDCDADLVNQGPYFRYWTQNFGRRTSVFPVVIEREAFETSTRNVDLYLYGAGFALGLRLRNESGAWTAWQSFVSDVAWQLSPGSGTKTVNVEISSGPGGTGSVLSASDTILLDDGTGLIFSDDFESGSTSAWSDTGP